MLLILHTIAQELTDNVIAIAQKLTDNIMNIIDQHLILRTIAQELTDNIMNIVPFLLTLNVRRFNGFEISFDCIRL